NGLNPEDLLGRRFGHHLNFWSMSERRLTQPVDLGDQHQMVFEVRPAHDPAKTWGFVGVVISVEDLSGSVWLWHRDGDRWAVRKVITVSARSVRANSVLAVAVDGPRLGSSWGQPWSAWKMLRTLGVLR